LGGQSPIRQNNGVFSTINRVNSVAQKNQFVYQINSGNSIKNHPLNLRDGGRTTSVISHNNIKRTSNFGVSPQNPPNFNMINGQFTPDIINSGEEIPEDVAQEMISMNLGMHPAANNQSQTPSHQHLMHHIV
jgi:hypothetical protein